VIISVHIPKTAGSTFQLILKKLFGKKYYHDDPIEGKEVPEDVQCIHGHFKATKYLEEFPGAMKIIWLRDPVDRFISEYYYRRDMASDRPDTRTAFIRAGASLEQITRSPMFHNMMTTFLDGVPLEDFDFIGLTEQFDRDIQRFFNMIGAVRVEWKDLLVNTSDEYKRAVSSIEPELVAKIKECNRQDIALYREGLVLTDV